MRLGTQLTFAFLAVALLPAGAVLVFTWFTVEERFQQEFRDRLDGVATGIRADLDKKGERITRKVHTLTQSEMIERMLVGMVRGNLDRRSLVPEASRWMKAWDLDLLSVMDKHGVVLSCGHLPARSGGREEPLWEVARQPMTPALRQVQILRNGSIETLLAMVVADRRRFNQAEVIVVGGWLLDEAFLMDLQNLSGADILIVDDDDRVIAAADDVPDPDWEQREELTYRRIAVPPGEDQPIAYVVAGVSETKLKEAQQRILIASLGAAVAGVLISWILGLLISRRIVGPVRALVEGSRSISRGDLGHRVQLATGGEIGELVQGFNHMADDLIVYRRRLVRAERVAAWQEIARRIAHEVKNPLSPIQMSIETMRKAYAAGHEDFAEIFEESTGAILEEVAALKRIVTEFSEFARMPKPSVSNQPLNPVIESAVSLHRNEAGNRLVWQAGDDVPPVAIDREQIGRVVTNLVSNALWASAPDGSVVITTGVREGKVVLRVADTGSGMPQEVLEKVFTPYFTTRPGGTGLGLAIVQRIVEDHGGNIEIESDEGRGTVVTISLPVAMT